MGRVKARKMTEFIKNLAPTQKPPKTPSSFQGRLLNSNGERSEGSRRIDWKKLMDVCQKPEDLTQRLTKRRLPLEAVVRDCTRRWFDDTLKEAKAGDSAMQILVAQMYRCGYGVNQDVDKGQAWLNRASRNRSSALKVGNKQPGYNASDSDSDDESTSVKK